MKKSTDVAVLHGSKANMQTCHVDARVHFKLLILMFYTSTIRRWTNWKSCKILILWQGGIEVIVNPESAVFRYERASILPTPVEWFLNVKNKYRFCNQHGGGINWRELLFESQELKESFWITEPSISNEPRNKSNNRIYLTRSWHTPFPADKVNGWVNERPCGKAEARQSPKQALIHLYEYYLPKFIIARVVHEFSCNFQTRHPGSRKETDGSVAGFPECRIRKY